MLLIIKPRRMWSKGCCFGSKETKIFIPTLPPTDCVTLGKSLDISRLWFLFLHIRRISVANFSSLRFHTHSVVPWLSVFATFICKAREDKSQFSPSCRIIQKDEVLFPGWHLCFQTVSGIWVSMQQEQKPWDAGLVIIYWLLPTYVSAQTFSSY